VPFCQYSSCSWRDLPSNCLITRSAPSRFMRTQSKVFFVFMLNGTKRFFGLQLHVGTSGAGLVPEIGQVVLVPELPDRGVRSAPGNAALSRRTSSIALALHRCRFSLVPRLLSRQERGIDSVSLRDGGHSPPYRCRHYVCPLGTRAARSRLERDPACPAVGPPSGKCNREDGGRSPPYRCRSNHVTF
jgi:hypothetical protein